MLVQHERRVRNMSQSTTPCLRSLGVRVKIGGKILAGISCSCSLIFLFLPQLGEGIDRKKRGPRSGCSRQGWWQRFRGRVKSSGSAAFASLRKGIWRSPIRAPVIVERVCESDSLMSGWWKAPLRQVWRCECFEHGCVP